MELSSFILLNEPQPKGRESVWPLKNWTTASPELLAAVVTWIVRPFCLLQWNLSWVKDKCVLSYFMASFVINSVLFSWPLLVASRYEDLIQSCREDGSSTKTLETRSQPPGKNEWNLDIRRDACSNFYCGMYLTQQQLHWMSFIFQSIFNSVSCHVTVDLYWLSVLFRVDPVLPVFWKKRESRMSLQEWPGWL